MPKLRLLFNNEFLGHNIFVINEQCVKINTWIQVCYVDYQSNFESSTPVSEPMHLNTPTNSNVLTIVSGIVLGSINFYSVVALYAAIDAYKENTAILFSLNNVGVVVLSTIVGWFFGERPVARVFWGMGLAILSILVLAF